jgi:hypothetical protein
LRDIIEDSLKINLVGKQQKYETLKMYVLITKSNYFSHDGNLLHQKGLAMGAPSSAMLSEMFLQFVESNSILDILVNYKILVYLRYVDDVLTVYNHSITDKNLVLQRFNKIHPNLQYTTELEKENKINFLDLTILRGNNSFDFRIFWKHTYRHYHPL